MRRWFERIGRVSYEEARDLARHPDAQVRRRIAARANTQPEILYFLAGDASAEVRREIAANTATPAKADLLLAHDTDGDVRCDLAAKIARLTPHLSADAHDRLRQITLEVLEILARDELGRVRRILAEALKDVAQAPPHVVRRLAQDPEIEVAAPVLQFSPLLTDEDLLAIIASTSLAGTSLTNTAASGRLAAISRRAGVSVRVSDAIAGTSDTDAVAALLANPSAQIREETLDLLIEQAPPHVPWHSPLVHRPHLPPDSACKLASFVADSLLTALMRRRDFTPDVVRKVARVVRQRIADGEGLTSPDGYIVDADDAQKDKARGLRAEEAAGKLDRAALREGGARLADYVRRLHAAGQLDEAAFDEGLGLGHSEFVTLALACRAGVPATVVARAAAARSGKGVTALAWKAGLTMRFAIKLQARFAGIAPADIVNARNGTDYPLTPDEMTWLIEFFGD